MKRSARSQAKKSQKFWLWLAGLFMPKKGERDRAMLLTLAGELAAAPKLARKAFRQWLASLVSRNQVTSKLPPPNWWAMRGYAGEEVETLFYTSRGLVAGPEYFGEVFTNEDHYGVQKALIYTRALAFGFLTSQEFEAATQVPVIKDLANFFSPIVLQAPVEFVGPDASQQFIARTQADSNEHKLVVPIHHGVFTKYLKSAADASYVKLALQPIGATVINIDPPTRGAIPVTYEGDVETEQAMTARIAQLLFELMMALPDRTFDSAGHSRGADEVNQTMIVLERMIVAAENEVLKSEKEALEAENAALHAEIDALKQGKPASLPSATTQPAPSAPVDSMAILRRRRLARTKKPFRTIQLLADDTYDATYVSLYHQCLMRNCEYIYGYQSPSRDHLLQASVAEHMDTLDQLKLLIPKSLREKLKISVDYRNRTGLVQPVLPGLIRIDDTVKEDWVGHAFEIVLAALVTFAVTDGNGRDLDKYVGFERDPNSPKDSPLFIVQASLPDQIMAAIQAHGLAASVQTHLKISR